MSRKKTHEEFVDEIYNIVQNEYSILGRYVNAKTKIEFKHNICEYVYKVLPCDFTSGDRRCPKCAGKVRKDNDYFQNELNEIFGEGQYLILGKYKNQKTKIELAHTSCNYEFEVYPTNLVKGHGCPKCSGKMLKTNEQFLIELYELVGEEYVSINDYINSKTKIKFKHSVCGNVYETTPDRFLNNGRRCPYCNTSRGEDEIRLYLERRNIRYGHQHRFEDCRNQNPLPFDFAIFKENNLIYLIEFDGEQHYKPKEYFGGDEYLKQVKLHDYIKNEYCKQNNIPLLRISYWEFDDIEEILEREFNNLIEEVV